MIETGARRREIDDVASELYEVERALQHASRRLQRIVERA
jgi:hypothetical protein